MPTIADTQTGEIIEPKLAKIDTAGTRFFEMYMEWSKLDADDKLALEQDMAKFAGLVATFQAVVLEAQNKQ